MPLILWEWSIVIQASRILPLIISSAACNIAASSATDWVKGGWDLEQSIQLARALKPIGVDLIDCSSGAMVPYAKIPAAPGFQVQFAEAIRREAGILTGAVGLITEIEPANAIVSSGQADLVLLAREMLREPYWALKAEAALGASPTWPTQYGYAVKRKT